MHPTPAIAGLAARDAATDHEAITARRPPSPFGALLLVAAGYYVGANIGLILRFPTSTPSVLWPPNSILTAALLLMPVHRWWMVILAALPAHLAAEIPAGWPLVLVMALFATNCLEAVLAAGLVRRFSDAPTRFDTLDRVGVFLVSAGIVAPVVSTVFDAGVVHLVLDEPFHRVAFTRLSSNVLTAVTLVPTIVIAATGMPVWMRRASPARRLEAAGLACAVCVLSLVVFGARGFSAPHIPGAPVTPLVFLLPFILWAAVRFGPAGTSLALLATAVLASWAATYATGPFHGLRAPESVLALQMSLVVVAVPMLCLGALIEERRRAERALVARLEFEEMLSRLSGAFVHVTSAEMSAAFDHWCERLGAFLGLAEVTLGLGPAPAPFGAGQAPGRRGRSSVSVPLTVGDRLFGTLTFVAAVADHRWSDELRQRLRLIAQVFANALARKEGDDALRESEEMKSAILESVSSGVAVLDRQGRVIAANDGWQRLAADPDASPIMCGVGANFLDACGEAGRRQVLHAAEVGAGVRAVLTERRPEFAIEYGRARGGGPWFAISVVPLNRPEGGAVVSKTDVTERKRAEMDAERSRQELAHFSRVSTMGELTASLAHELNQPLTGILINAQTARRFLDADPPATAELRDILSDIVEDDTRAAEIIRRLRDLLRKGETERVRLDLNELIRDVIRLLGSDAVIRNVTLSFEGGGQPLMVHGDRIELQQVMLNLLLNAMEAVAESAASDRRVAVRTSKEEGLAHVAIRDAGPGLRAGTHELVFDPFYTTKPTGMGMGLSIVRSIIRLHDGSISAVDNPTGGATFRFALPSADVEAA